MKQNQQLSTIFVYFMAFVLMAIMVFGVQAKQSAVDLGTAGNFVILSKSGISTTGTTSITGDIGVSPIDSTAITGFGLTMDSTNQFATASLVTGKIYAADYTPPTPAVMTTAISDMETAYTDAAGRTLPDYTEFGAGNIDGMTLAPGLYKWGTGVAIPNGVTLSGGADDVWILQIAQDLTVGNGAIITLSGGAQAKNIFWQVAGETTLGTTSDFKGIILSKTAIVMNTGAKLNGKALAQTAVTLDASTVLNTILLPVVKTSETTETISEIKTIVEQKSNIERVDSTIQQQLSNKNETIFIAQNENNLVEKVKNSINQSFSVEKNQTLQGIGQELNKLIVERKEEIKSGDYKINGSLGQLLNVKELAQNLRELRINGISAQTNLSIIAETDSNGKTKLKTKLKNETEIEIKIMPDTASQRALERLGLKVCSADNNCTIKLKSVENGKTEKIQYEVQLERHSRILGIFQKKMQVSADVDAETGKTKEHKPWWAFMATEPTE